MPFARLASISRLAAVSTLGTALTLTCWGQELPNKPTPQNTPEATPVPALNYSKGASHFPNPIAPYIPRQVPDPNLANTARIDQLMHDGKLYLSLNDAIALALENNLDIAIARYNLNIADTDVLRAKAGAQILGVNLGVVQNTPGGGVGGIGTQVGTGTGGTTLGAGGAGAGAGGIVGSTAGGLFGPPITSFDPILTGTFQSDHATFVPTSPFQGSFQGTTSANFQYTQGFHWGTNLAVGFNNSRVSSNSGFQSVSPALNSGFQFRLTQHLLQGFGFPANTRFIRIAKNNREISDVAFRLQIITTVDQIENMYWDLVYAYENVRVQQEALTYTQKALEDAKRQAQVGTVPPIQVVSAQSTVATGQQNLIVAQNNLQLQQLLMKNAVSRSIEDPILAEADVIPISTMLVPQQEPVTPIQDLISDALQHRAELVQTRIDLNSRDINVKSVRNSMLPTLQAFAYYGGSGVGGDVNPAVPTCSSSSGSFCFNSAKAPPPFQTATSVSYGGTLNQLVNSTAPDKGVGLALNIPIRNRLAQSNQVRAELEYRKAAVRQHQLENQVRIEVRNAQFEVKQNRSAGQAAQSAVDLARQTFEA